MHYTYPGIIALLLYALYVTLENGEKITSREIELEKKIRGIAFLYKINSKLTMGKIF